MAIEDIISEEITTQDPNMQIAQGSPDDFMSEDEMDPYQDPEFQQLLDSMPAEQAQALMQLIKEYKEMVAQGFQGEFEDFVKIKMATAQGDDDINEFQSEDEMIIEPDEMMDIEKQIVPTEMAAEGGRIDPPKMGNPPVFEKIEDMREWKIANPDVEDVADYKGYYERLKKKRKKKQEGGIMDVIEEDEVVETGPSRQEMIMQYLRDRGLPITPENIQKAIIEMITGGMPYTEEAAYDMPQMDQPSVLPRGMMVDESMIQRTPSGIASVNVMEDIIPEPRPYIYDAPVQQQPWDTQQSTMFAAHGGRAGFQEGGPVSDEEEYEQYKSEKEAAGEEYMDFDTYKLFKIQFPMAEGGIAGLRQGYFLGKIVKKITKPIKKLGSKLVKSVKKFAKSDLGKAALMYMATAGAANIGAGGGMSGLFKASTYNPMTVGSNIGSSWTNLKSLFTPAAKTTDSSLLSDVLKQSLAADDKKALVKAGYDLSNLGPSQPSGLMAMAGKALKNPMITIPAAMIAGGAYTAANPGEENLDRVMANYNQEVSDFDNIMANIRSGQTVTPFTTGNVMFPYPNYYLNVADGGRVARAEGGIMDLGGMEKDYRETGGFVPIGEYEKKDDVPARLSLNEFVMTADAVRGAGNGDVDKGAEVMEDMMETLEEQGRRHRQAQDMFSVSERLSEVVN
jgi:hypothetical protein